jgi:hypothetical protein
MEERWVSTPRALDRLCACSAVWMRFAAEAWMR